MIKVRGFIKAFSKQICFIKAINTSGLLNRGAITDLLVLRTLLAIHQMSCSSSFWIEMDSFVLSA